MQRENGYKEDSRTFKGGIVKEEESTHTTHTKHSILETVREEDETEEPISVFDKSDKGKWVREEAVVDSGAVESRKRMPQNHSQFAIV